MYSSLHLGAGVFDGQRVVVGLVDTEVNELVLMVPIQFRSYHRTMIIIISGWKQ